MLLKMRLLLFLTILQVNPTLSVPIPAENICIYPVESNNTVLAERGDYRDKYVAVAIDNNPYKAKYQPVGVITSSASSGVAQIPPLLLAANPDPIVTVITSLEDGGRSSVVPFPTGRIPNPTALIVPFGPALVPEEPKAVSTPKTPSPPKTSPTPKPPSAPKVSYAPKATSSPKPTTMAKASANIFAAAIGTSAPPASFQVKPDHPVPRLGINGKGPYQTNKFYANFFLGAQNSPAFVHPYSIAWSKGKGHTSSWGMSITHTEPNQRVFGDVYPDTGAAKYYLNPIGIQSMVLSATELGDKTALTIDSMTGHGANVNLSADPKGKPLISFPVVQGMGFVTGAYRGSTPLIQSGVFFKTVTKSTKGPKPGITKYTFYLEDGKVWHLYAYSAKGVALDLQVVNNGLAKASKPFDGTIQIAKDPGGAETMIDNSAGAYPVDATLTGSADGSKGTYSFQFSKAGLLASTLMMYALPHHMESFDTATKNATSNFQLQTTTKGMATAVVADKWTMIEPNLPVSMAFAPWDKVSGSKTTLKPDAIKVIGPVALKELSQNVDQQSNLNSMYFSGKALAKFAQMCYVAHDMLKDQNLAKGGLDNLKAAFNRFATNRQQFPLYYESAWGGVVSSATYQTGNSGADFGNTYYNDHHFHYGYFIYAAAAIGSLDPTWLTKENVDYVNTLVRDIANPSSADKYFPVFRSFDWYHGHSWAHGLYESYDGKNQESSSEDAMAAYAVKMWGATIKDTNMETRGNLMLSVMSRALSHYYLYQSDNKVQPANFIGNRVAGILFENKCDHTTFFGNNIEYIQGIHMMPLLPSTKLTRPPQFVTEEWSTYFDKGRADKIEGGWRAIVYGNLATADPKTAWNFFTAKNFDMGWLDGGASLTWYQAYAAAFM